MSIFETESFQREWQKLRKMPLRIKVTVEQEDGTELYAFDPMPGARPVYVGETVSIQFEISLQAS